MIPFIPNPADKSGGAHRDNYHFQRILPRKNVPPRNTPDSFCRLLHPTKSIAALLGRYFSLWETYLENFISRPDVIPTFRQRRCKTGAGTSFGANGDQHTRAAELSTYFCVLTIRKQLSEMRFERSGGEQEPSRGHKFSILENVVLHRDFTSATLASFDVLLLGRTCPKPCSYSHLAVRKNGVSCLHSSTEELAKRQEVQ